MTNDNHHHRHHFAIRYSRMLCLYFWVCFTGNGRWQFWRGRKRCCRRHRWASLHWSDNVLSGTIETSDWIPLPVFVPTHSHSFSSLWTKPFPVPYIPSAHSDLDEDSNAPLPQDHCDLLLDAIDAQLSRLQVSVLQPPLEFHRVLDS